jgi:uncharacterized protein
MMTSTSPAPPPPVLDLSRIAQDLQIRKVHVENVVHLLDEGNTVPFITRYRKERTGGLNEEVIRRIQHRVQQLRALADRKQTILKTIENQGKLTDELRAAILAADSPKRLEDLYLPYKPKKRSVASEAREKGLEPLALSIWNKDPAVANLAELLPNMVNPEKQLTSVDDVLTGVRNILAEVISETADLRGAARTILWDPAAQLVSKKNEALPEGKGQEFKGYFDFKESVQSIPPHRILAINRGEKEEVLKVKVEYDLERVKAVAREKVPLGDHPHRELLEPVLDDALNRLLLPSLEREVRRELTDFAQEHAVAVFARNLRSLLLQPPLRARRILGIDPGLRTGCKLAALDESGNLLDHAVIYPHQPQNKKAEAKVKLEELIRKHQLGVVAIGNGTACRETERLISELIAEFEARRSGTAKPAEEVRAPEPAAGQEQKGAAGATLETAPTAPAESAAASPEPAPAVVEQPLSAAASESAPAASVESPPMVSEAGLAALESTPPPAGEPAPEAAVAATPPAEATAPSTPAETAPAAPPPIPPAPETPKIDLSGLPDPPSDLAYVIVNEAGASDYSASDVAREEFPNFDATLRGTISIGRRLQDPLSELVKIDPQHVGVGLYQHDVRPKNLKESLSHVVESCVNYVGVDLNTASVPLLRHVSGMNAMVARDVVEFRKQHGPFKRREQLQAVPSVGPQRYQQAAGFLRIPGGEEPLDETWIHPESYAIAQQILADMGFTPADLRDREKLQQVRSKLSTVHAEVYAEKANTGLPTVKDIFDALSCPSRDPRDDLPPPIFRKGILKIEDLQPGMELKGTVLNVVDFGAFVDIGLKDSGLVHISQMANRYIKNPYEVVSVGDVVTVWVRSINMEQRHVALTMIVPGTERKPAERRPAPPREPRREAPPAPDRAREQGAPHRDQDGPRRGPRRGGHRRQGAPAPRGAGPHPTAPAATPAPEHHAAAASAAPPAGLAPAPGTTPTTRPAPSPPRRHERPKPLPKLTQAALTGQTPLHSFGELAAFFKAKEDVPASEPASAAAPEPVAEVVAAPAAEAAPQVPAPE